MNIRNVNKVNPNKHDGIIPSGNLCQESFSNVTPLEVKLENGLIKEVSGWHSIRILVILVSSVLSLSLVHQ